MARSGEGRLLPDSIPEAPDAATELGLKPRLTPAKRKHPATSLGSMPLLSIHVLACDLAEDGLLPSVPLPPPPPPSCPLLRLDRRRRIC
uniref:Uncharacterized protein n=1 Tax=Aegilops tauschii TaxID=37682 RepID=M8BWN0_AEGTA